MKMCIRNSSTSTIESDDRECSVFYNIAGLIIIKPGRMPRQKGYSKQNADVPGIPDSSQSDHQEISCSDYEQNSP